MNPASKPPSSPPADYSCFLCGLKGHHYGDHCPENLLTAVREEVTASAPRGVAKNELKRMIRKELFARLRSRKLQRMQAEAEVKEEKEEVKEVKEVVKEEEEVKEVKEETQMFTDAELHQMKAAFAPSSTSSTSSSTSSASLIPTSSSTFTKPRISEIHDLQRERARELTKDGIKVALDLSFGALMSEEEMRSLRAQIGAAYGFSIGMRQPGRLILTSLKDSMLTLMNQVSGIEDWAVDRTDQHFREAFRREIDEDRLVYLTPDSPSVLEEVKKDRVYVVGGFVDRVPQKGVSLGRAQQLGIRTARLPLKHYVRVKRSDRLPVNQVIQLLLLVGQQVDWAEAIRMVVPHQPTLK